ncbi:MAG: ATP-binding protein [Anaerolineales bacterium]
MVDPSTLEFVYSLLQTAGLQVDWKTALDKLLSSLREEFVYDNVAVYLLDSRSQSVDVGYARAVGRGKDAEADISWGEGIAGKVIARQHTIVREPTGLPATNRLDAPYLIGLPLFAGGRLLGALVFVRFGGPVYSPQQRLLGEMIGRVVSSMLESKALQEARRQLESVQRQMRLQDDFVSTISHELRTPLGFIKGYSTSLLRQDAHWDEKTQREFLTIIDEETDRLTHLIEDMLESARLQSHTVKFKFQPLRLDALVRDVTTRIHAYKPQVQIDLDFDVVPPILGDGVQLAQVFENLFSNAIKYTSGSPLKISMRRLPASLQVAFADQGPGIPEEYLPFIFERFYRVPAETTATGTGLGLYICKQIILAHHGKIWAESELDKGTTFFIELPVEVTI